MLVNDPRERRTVSELLAEIENFALFLFKTANLKEKVIPQVENSYMQRESVTGDYKERLDAMLSS